jgi:ribonuclease VapC
MFLETSAIIEILLDTERSKDLIAQLERSGSPRSTAPTVVYEATTVLAGKQNLDVPVAERLVRSLLSALDVETLAVTDQTASVAIDAFARYGKGRHPAKLNFGDCFSYAGAKAADVSLLYVGDDFAQTDLA